MAPSVPANEPAPQMAPQIAPPVAMPAAADPVLPEQPASIPESMPELPAYVPPAQPVQVQPVRSYTPAAVERSSAKTAGAIFQIEVDKIKPNPDQPRRVFDEDALRELASSIREFGLLQPIVVTKVEHEIPTGTEVEYVLISGERRLMASKLLGLERIPAIIRNVDLDRERLELAIIENIQRENLNPIEIARSFARLQDEFRFTQREIAARLGKSREVVANAVRLLDLPQNIQDAISQGKIGESHGRLLLTIDDQGLQEKMFQDLIGQHLTTRELKLRVDAVRNKTTEEVVKPEVSPEIQMIQQKLSSELGAPVAIQKHGDTGKITITFYSQEELQSILQKIEKEF